MKTSSKTAIAALVAASLGLAGLALPALAQGGMGAFYSQHPMFGSHGPMMGGMRGEFMGPVCAEDGARHLEHAFLRMAHRIDMTAAQETLFEALRAGALTAQTGFADDCEAARPGRTAEGRADVVDRFKAEIAIESARIEALRAILPDLEAFFASLTDAQKAELGAHGGWHHRDGFHHGAVRTPDGNG